MKRNIVKLNEAALRKIVSESVRRILNEGRGNIYMQLDGNDFLDWVFNDVDPVEYGAGEGEDVDWYETYRGQDPAIDQIMDAEFEIYATASYHNYQDNGGQNDVDFEIVDDEGLWDLIRQIKNPAIKNAAMKEYEDVCENERYYDVYDPW